MCGEDAGTTVYYIKSHIDYPNTPNYMIGYTSDNPYPERFKLCCPSPLAIGERGTVIGLSTRALNRPYPTIINVDINHDGYRVIPPNHHDGTKRVCRLVAQYWCYNPHPEDYNEVDHIDGNKLNDNAYNLRWVNHKINMCNIYHRAPNTKWDDADYAIALYKDDTKLPVLCHPSKLTGITGSSNISHCIVRHDRNSCNGWTPMINPTYDDVIATMSDMDIFDRFTVLYIKKLFDNLNERSVS